MIKINGNVYSLETRTNGKVSYVWYRNFTECIGEELPQEIQVYLNELSLQDENIKEMIYSREQEIIKLNQQISYIDEELKTLRNLLRGEYANSVMLKKLSLEKLILI